MKFKLTTEALILWRIYALIVMIWGLLLCGLLSVMLPLPVTAVLLILIILLFAFAFFYYLPHLHRSVKIVLTDEALMYTRGVFFNQKYIMPRPRMIYVQQFNTPISAAMRLRNIRLRAARSQLTVFSLSYDDADAIVRAIDPDTENNWGGV